MKHQKPKRPARTEHKTELRPDSLRDNPTFIQWHKENFTEAEHAQFLAGGVLPPLMDSKHQPNETE